MKQGWVGARSRGASSSGGSSTTATLSVTGTCWRDWTRETRCSDGHSQRPQQRLILLPPFSPVPFVWPCFQLPLHSGLCSCQVQRRGPSVTLLSVLWRDAWALCKLIMPLKWHHFHSLSTKSIPGCVLFFCLQDNLLLSSSRITFPPILSHIFHSSCHYHGLLGSTQKDNENRLQHDCEMLWNIRSLSWSLALDKCQLCDEHVLAALLPSSESAHCLWVILSMVQRSAEPRAQARWHLTSSAQLWDAGERQCCQRWRMKS